MYPYISADPGSDSPESCLGRRLMVGENDFTITVHLPNFCYTFLMSSVQFEIEDTPRPYSKQRSSKLVGWIVKYSGGLIKGEAQANYALLAFVVVMVLFSLFLVFGQKKSSNFVIPQEMFIKEQSYQNK